MSATFRYYAYSPEMGRVRVPDDMAKNKSTVIDWAAGRGAVNVVREDGPASKPTAVTFIWKIDEKPQRVIEDEIFAEIVKHFPEATGRDVTALTAALLKIVS